MQIAIVFVFCWCVFLVEGNERMSTLTDNKESDTRSMQHKYRHTSVGYLFWLSCPYANRAQISLSRAYYGIYRDSCIEGKCRPDPYEDCRQSVMDVNGTEWASLQVLCDNQNTCTYPYRAREIKGCYPDDPDRVAMTDYMQVYYDCLPAVGCMGELFNLSCPGEKSIKIYDGFFGAYKYPCARKCCFPTPDEDCRQAIEVVNPAIWDALFYECDNKNKCKFPSYEEEINGCEGGDWAVQADYMHVYYYCV